jgi:hypothetical protein
MYPSSSRKYGCGEYEELMTVRYLVFAGMKLGESGCVYKGKKNLRGQFVCGQQGQMFYSRVDAANHSLACQAGSGKKVKNNRHYAVVDCVEAEARCGGCREIYKEPRADPSGEEDENGRVNRTRLYLSVMLRYRHRDGANGLKVHEIDFSGVSCKSGEELPKQLQGRITNKVTLYGEPVARRGGVLVAAVFSPWGYLSAPFENLMEKIRKEAKSNSVMREQGMNLGFECRMAKICARAIVCGWRNILPDTVPWVEETKKKKEREYWERIDYNFRNE